MSGTDPFTPKAHSRAEAAALSAFEEGVKSVFEPLEVRHKRRDDLVESLGPSLPSTCMGTYCPALGAISTTHQLEKIDVADHIVLKGMDEAAVERRRGLDDKWSQLFGGLLDKVARGEMSTETADHIIAAKQSAGVDLETMAQNQGHVIRNEAEMQAEILEREKKIAEGKTKLSRLEEIHSVMYFSPSGLRLLWAHLRRIAKRSPKDGECFGARLDNLGTLKRFRLFLKPCELEGNSSGEEAISKPGEKFVCTSGRCALFLSAVDEGLIELRPTEE